MVEDAVTAPAWRVLVCAPFPPRLDGRHGGSRALAQFLSRLARRHRVALVVLKSEDEPSVDDTLTRLCDVVEQVEIPRVDNSLSARLNNRIRLRAALFGGIPTWAAERTAKDFGVRLQDLVQTWRPDVIQFEYRIMGRFLSTLDGSVPCLLVDLDPVSSEGSVSPLLSPLEARAWRSLGRSVSKQVDSLVVLTEHDRELVTDLSEAAPITCIPLAYELPPLPLDPEGADPTNVLSVGSFIHPPNIDAALWLAREIFPAVRARVPAASLQLVGSHAPASIRGLHGPGLTVSADVPDVLPYLDAAAVVAAPIRMGGGMRVKVLEALAYGKAVVGTRLGLEGLDVEDGVQAVIADTAEDFAAALAELLTDRERRTTIASAARAWAEENLDPDSQIRAYERLYASLVEKRTRLGPAPAPPPA
jgi:glycosyltransferase involved in cell wall biosynthesis